MPSFLSGFDWRKSPAHCLLLTKFLYPQSQEEFADKDYWQKALGESPEKATKRFLDERLVGPASPRAILECMVTATQIKDMARQRGLKVSGKKAELVERLFHADPDGMVTATQGLNLIQCTDDGRSAAEEYLSRAQQEKAEAERQSLEALRKRNYKEASQIVASFEAKQVFPRGLNMDWKNHDVSGDAKTLQMMFETKPDILSAVAEAALDPLRLGAGMMYLWGTSRAKGWMPPDLQTGLKMDNDTAASMIYFHASYSRQLEQYRESGVVKGVEIITMDDSCEECRKLSGKTFRISQAPILPNGKCTSPMGCRCDSAPVVD